MNDRLQQLATWIFAAGMDRGKRAFVKATNHEKLRAMNEHITLAVRIRNDIENEIAEADAAQRKRDDAGRGQTAFAGKARPEAPQSASLNGNGAGPRGAADKANVSASAPLPTERNERGPKISAGDGYMALAPFVPTVRPGAGPVSIADKANKRVPAPARSAASSGLVAAKQAAARVVLNMDTHMISGRAFGDWTPAMALEQAPRMAKDGLLLLLAARQYANAPGHKPFRELFNDSAFLALRKKAEETTHAV